MLNNHHQTAVSANLIVAHTQTSLDNSRLKTSRRSAKNTHRYRKARRRNTSRAPRNVPMTRLLVAEIISSIAMDTVRTYVRQTDSRCATHDVCARVSSARAICSRVSDNELSPRLLDERCRTASRRTDGRYT